MLIKIVQIVFFHALFLLVYRLWLQKETFFNANRVYLLVSSILAILIPFLSDFIEYFKIENQNLLLPKAAQVVLTSHRIELPELLFSTNQNAIYFPSLLGVYIFGIIVTSILFSRKLFKLFKIISQNKKQKTEYYTLVTLPNSTIAFSFLNHIFIGENVKDTECLHNHEKVHILQNHSWDLLWFELLKIVLWFNPILYLYQKSMLTLHEYIADAIIIKTQKTDYYNRLLNDFFQIENIAFVNQFYKQSLIKKRIIMMTKNKSKSWKTIKYVLMLPFFVSMMLFSLNLKAQDDIKDAVPFAIIDNAPIFPGCENRRSTEAKKECFSESIQKFIVKNFNVDLAQSLDLKPGKKRIFTRFIISKEGEIIDVEVRAPHPDLKAEAKRVINQLPKMIPAEYKNKNVAVKYSLPIVFIIEGEDKDEKIEEKQNSENHAIPFSLIEQVPVFPGCENDVDKGKCLSKNIQKYFLENFNRDLMQNLKLPKGEHKIFAMFTIDIEGNITNIRARAPHQELENEAKRVIKLLPKMQPGQQKGNDVGVKYSLPISFVVK